MIAEIPHRAIAKIRCGQTRIDFDDRVARTISRVGERQIKSEIADPITRRGTSEKLVGQPLAAGDLVVISK